MIYLHYISEKERNQDFSSLFADNAIVIYNIDSISFSERLKDLMAESQINATQLNSALKCGNATTNHYLSGKILPSTEMVIKLADYFSCTCDYLLGLESENYANLFKACPPFNERLKELCIIHRITRYRLQKITNIPESVLRYWAKGKTTPSIVNIVKIAEALQCSVDYVLGRET